MTREEMIDMAVRRELAPMWQRHFVKYPKNLSTVVFCDTGTTALAAIRAECCRIAKESVPYNLPMLRKYHYQSWGGNWMD
jgi:hypothetical protein